MLAVNSEVAYSSPGGAKLSLNLPSSGNPLNALPTLAPRFQAFAAGNRYNAAACSSVVSSAAAAGYLPSPTDSPLWAPTASANYNTDGTLNYVPVPISTASRRGTAATSLSSFSSPQCLSVSEYAARRPPPAALRYPSTYSLIRFQLLSARPYCRLHLHLHPHLRLDSTLSLELDLHFVRRIPS